ncbi:transporter substrate-binding domain-containing protein [bacterium]|nr:MAG: transporter substrate-binding domain-containing protein [bacterium]
MAEDALDRIQRTKVFNWGSDAEGGAPFCYYNPENPSELIGFEVDIIKKIAAKLGAKSVMIQNDWDGLVPALKRGTFDMATNGIEITESRKKEINFSIPYFIYTQQIVTRKDNTSIKGPKDLKGKAVGTLSASAAMNALLSLGLEIGSEIKLYPTVVGPYTDLQNQRLDAVVLEYIIAIYYAKSNKELKFVGEPFAKGFYGFCIRKEDTKLLKKVNEVLMEMMKSGELEQIYKKWGLWTEEQRNLLNYTENAPIKEIKKKSTLERASKELPLLLGAALVTIQICIISMIIAIILGLSIAILRMYGPKPLGYLLAAYVEVMRGTPLLVQLYIIYYGLSEVGINFEPYTAAVMGLSLNYAAYEAEIYRAGIKSIHKGQMEAALALGMTQNMALRKVIIPQAIRVVIPPVTNDFIAMFKDSSIVSVITMVELTKQYNFLASTTYDYIGLGLMTAAIYFFMSYPASLFAKRIEKKLANEK